VSHANARTTVQGRLLIVERAAAGWPQAHIAKAMGISRKCVKTWLDRHATGGVSGLRDRSSRPRSTPTRTSAEVEARVLGLRREHRRGPDWIAAESGVPARTVSRGACPARRTAPDRTGPDHRSVDQVEQGHRDPLRARAARRAGPHGRQEAGPHPRRRRLSRAGPEHAQPPETVVHVEALIEIAGHAGNVLDESSTAGVTLHDPVVGLRPSRLHRANPGVTWLWWTGLDDVASRQWADRRSRRTTTGPLSRGPFSDQLDQLSRTAPTTLAS
jgi:hypothetical protein